VIRPFTCVTMLLAGTAGIYLYSSKHRVQLLDRQIEAIMHQAHEAREHTAILKAEWTLQNDPMRLKQLADKFLALKPVTPNQFTTLAELDKRLPPPRDRSDNPSPSRSETDQEPAAPEIPDAGSSSPPASPEPKTAHAKAEATKPAEVKLIEPKPALPHGAEQPRLQASHDTRPKQQTHVPWHKRELARVTPVVTRSVLAAPALSRPVATLAAEPAAPPQARVGMVSALGMARTALAPPVPVPQVAASLPRDGN
jgi:hypothetical protein